MPHTPSPSAVSEHTLRALFQRALRPLLLPSCALPAALACDCPVTTSQTQVIDELDASELAGYSVTYTDDMPLAACQTLCQEALNSGVASRGSSGRGQLLSCRLAPYSATTDDVWSGAADTAAPADDTRAPAEDTGAGEPTAAPTPAAVVTCEIQVTTDCGGVGRWQPGARLGGRCAGRGAPAVARWLADASALEALSVHAFAALGQALDRLGAPLALRQDVRRAQRDERRHARATRRLARAQGVTPRPVQLALPARPSLLTLARDNAVHGCLEETWGALLLSHQARHAPSAALRRHFRALATDETRHAALSWRLHAWLLPQLSADERATLTHAVREAREALQLSARREPDPALRAFAGLPSGPDAGALHDRLAGALFAAL